MTDEWYDYVEEIALREAQDYLIETLRQLPPEMKAELGICDTTDFVLLAKQLTLQTKHIVETGATLLQRGDK